MIELVQLTELALSLETFPPGWRGEARARRMRVATIVVRLERDSGLKGLNKLGLALVLRHTVEAARIELVLSLAVAPDLIEAGLSQSLLAGLRGRL